MVVTTLDQLNSELDFISKLKTPKSTGSESKFRDLREWCGAIISQESATRVLCTSAEIVRSLDYHLEFLKGHIFDEVIHSEVADVTEILLTEIIPLYKFDGAWELMELNHSTFYLWTLWLKGVFSTQLGSSYKLFHHTSDPHIQNLMMNSAGHMGSGSASDFVSQIDFTNSKDPFAVWKVIYMKYIHVSRKNFQSADLEILTSMSLVRRILIQGDQKSLHRTLKILWEGPLEPISELFRFCHPEISRPALLTAFIYTALTSEPDTRTLVENESKFRKELPYLYHVYRLLLDLAAAGLPKYRVGKSSSSFKESPASLVETGFYTSDPNTKMKAKEETNQELLDLYYDEHPLAQNGNFYDFSDPNIHVYERRFKECNDLILSGNTEKFMKSGIMHKSIFIFAIFIASNKAKNSLSNSLLNWLTDSNALMELQHFKPDIIEAIGFLQLFLFIEKIVNGFLKNKINSLLKYEDIADEDEMYEFCISLSDHPDSPFTLFNIAVFVLSDTWLDLNLQIARLKISKKQEYDTLFASLKEPAFNPNKNFWLVRKEGFHICPFKEMFERKTFDEKTVQKRFVERLQKHSSSISTRWYLKIEGIGEVKITVNKTTIVLKKVMYIPKMKYNVFSLGGYGITKAIFNDDLMDGEVTIVVPNVKKKGKTAPLYQSLKLPIRVGNFFNYFIDESELGIYEIETKKKLIEYSLPEEGTVEGVGNIVRE